MPQTYRPNPRSKRRILVTVLYGSQKVENFAVDPSSSLPSIIKSLWLSHFSLSGNPTNYCLRIVETEELVTQERLKWKLTDGTTLKLVPSPALMAAEMARDLTPEDDQAVLKRSIFLLQKYLKEDEFVDEFVTLGGPEKLQDIIITSEGNTLAYALTSLQTLMEHDRGWESFSPQFISTLVAIIVKQNLVNICRPATAIIIKLVAANANNNSSAIQSYGFDVVNNAISSQASFLPTLIQRLSATDYLLQLNSLSLLNSLFRHVTDRARGDFVQMLDALKTRRVIVNLMHSNPAEELKAQLIDYQRLLVAEGHRRRKTPVDFRNPSHAEKLADIWELSRIAPGTAPDWKRIGFTSLSPHKDLNRVGVLGLEVMHYFVHYDTATYQSWFDEQPGQEPEHACPFGRAAIEVCEIMADHWEVSTGYSTTTTYQPLLLLYQDVFCILAQSFLRIWREMDLESTDNDVPRVSTLVRSQFKHAVESVQRNSNDVVAAFRTLVLDTPYSAIRERQLKNLEVEDQLLSKPPVRNLRERFYKESYETVKRQRIDRLKYGAWFPVVREKGRIKGLYRFYRLGANHKFLHYGEFVEVLKRRPGIEELSERIDMSLATGLLTGLSSPVFSSKKNAGETAALCFSLKSSSSSDTASPTMADFICSTQVQYSEWTDGFNMLLDKNIVNRDTADYIAALTDVAVTLALLDLTGENIDVVAAATETEAGSELEYPTGPFYYDDGGSHAMSSSIDSLGTQLTDGRAEYRFRRHSLGRLYTHEDGISEASDDNDDDGETFSEAGGSQFETASAMQGDRMDYDDDDDVDYDFVAPPILT
ncbi:ELMO/CED-12 family-domain-containing protein [Fimicolochytrium jonesii]|uniref:ELMO/CED-12 family-domain-containing protein n=1 Tax=Fimicolochytrium jonesii TaxID=1396493 RepID=UPI0022FF191B|nr:ELMO/CED-12 family-domain-containing protein [Fimicolochytrium jonesii]KAI8824188.1 ELMO/CED-12 family-domain-containing protein [Fimicolochytrium jonesii]